MSEKERFVVGSNDVGEIIVTDVETDRAYRYGAIHNFLGLIRLLNEQQDNINKLKEENEQLKNNIDVLEDDNETYHKSLETLNLYTKRFIPTKCTNEFKDCKTNRYYWVDHEGNFKGCLELLNLLDCENEVLKSENRQLKARLMECSDKIWKEYEKREKLTE